MKMAMAAVASSPLRLEEIPGRGRAFVACRPIQAGEILLRDSPILVYPNLNSLINCSFCFHCFRSLSSSSPSSASASTSSPSPSPSPSCYTDSNCRDTFLPCLSCSLARFCSEACRSAALSSSHSPWPCHTLSALLHNASSSLLLLHNDNHSSCDLLTQAAFLVYSFNLSLHSPSAFSNLLSLQGTASASSDSDSRGVEMKKKDDDDDEDKSIFLRSLISSISSEFASFSPQLVSALLAKDKLNAFGFMEPFAAGSGQRAVRAYAIYPRASFFNHDCLPNACRFDYVDAAAAEGNTDVIVRSIHDIMQGREVCLSYFPVNWGYKERQRRLIYDYGFACHCDRCQVESRWKEEEEEEVGGMDVDEAMDVDAAEEEEEYPGYLREVEVEVEVDVDERDNGDFPHAYFFMSYVCEQDNCGGTLAPLPPSSSQGKPTNNVMECNVCGHLRVDELRGLTG